MRDEPFVRIAKALADPTRHRMLRELRARGSLTCSGVCRCFNLSQPTISHHISTLQEAGLIRVRQRGQFHILTVNEKALAAFAGDLFPGARRRGPVPAARKPRR